MKEGRREGRSDVGAAATGADDEWFQSLIAQYGFDDDGGAANKCSFHEIERTDGESRWLQISESRPSESTRRNNSTTVNRKSRPKRNQRQHLRAVNERDAEQPKTSQNARRRTSSKSETSSFATKSSRQKSRRRKEDKYGSSSISISTKTRRRSDRNSGVVLEKDRKKHGNSKIPSKYCDRNKAIPTTLDLSVLKSQHFDTRRVDRVNLYHRVRASLLENMQFSLRLFADLKAELELLSVFPATTKGNKDQPSPEFGQTVTLLRCLLQNSESIDVLFKELMIPLLDEVWIARDDLCRTHTLTALCRLAILCKLQTSHLQRHSMSPHATNGSKNNPVQMPDFFTWCQRSETVHTTLFEMLNYELRSLFLFLGIAKDNFEFQIQNVVSKKLKDAWKATGHGNALETICFLHDDEQGSSAMSVQRDSIFSEVCCDVLVSMDQWCPAHPTILLKFLNSTLYEWQTLLDAPIDVPINANDSSESSACGLDSDFSSGLYSDEKLAPIPKQAEKVIAKISVTLLPRQDAVERVIKRILPFHHKGQDSGHCNDTVSSLNTTLTLEVNLLKRKNTSNQYPQEPNKDVIDCRRAQTKQTIVAIAPLQIASRLGATETTKGIGKTTIAALVAHNPEVRSHFMDGVIWLSFQHSPGTHLSYGRYRCLLEELLRQLQRASGHMTPGDNSVDQKHKLAQPEFPDLIPIFQGKSQNQIQRQNLEDGFKTHCFEKMAKFLQNKRILLILDNLPDVETLRWFKFWHVSKPAIGSQCTGSSVVVTTSSRRLLSASETAALGPFTTEEAIDLLTLRSIHSGTADFEDMSQTINMAKLFHPVHVASVCNFLDHFCCHCPCEKRNTYLKKFCYTIATDIQRDGFPSPTINHILGRSITPSAILMKPNPEVVNRSGALKLCFTAYAALLCEKRGTSPVSTNADYNVCPFQVPLATVDRFFHLLLVNNLEPFRQLSANDQQGYAILVREDLVKLGCLCLSQPEPQGASKRHLKMGSTEAKYVSLASSLHIEYSHSLFERSKGNRTTALHHAWNRLLAESIVAEVERLDTLKLDIDFADWHWKAAMIRDSPTLEYALHWLPIHLIKAEMYHEADSLLKTKSFVHDRLFCLGVDTASERLIHDVHFLLAHFPQERKKMVKLAYRPMESILTQMLQQERSGYDDADPDEKKEDSSPSTGLDKDEVYKIGRAFWRLGQSLVQLNEFEAALPLWQFSLGAFSESPGRCTEITATTFYNIGILYGTKKLDHDEAIYHLTECLNIRREIHGENHILCSQALGALSDSFASIGELEDAKTGYRLSLDLLKTMPRQGRVLTGHLHERLGDVYFKQFNWKAALECYNSALLYKQAECGEGHQELASLYRQVGLVYTEMDHHSNLGLKNIKKAIQLTAAALKQHTNATGKHDKREEAQLLQLRGLAKSLQDRRGESLRFYKESLKLYNEYMVELSMTSDEEPVAEKRHVASLLHSIACIYLQLAEYARAVHFFQDSLHARRNVSGQYMQCSMMEVSNTLFRMAQAHEKQDEADNALASFDEAILIRKTYFPDSETSEVAAMRHE